LISNDQGFFYVSILRHETRDTRHETRDTRHETLVVSVKREVK